MKLKGMLIIGVAALLLVGVVCYQAASKEAAEPGPVAEVDGSPITVVEFEKELARQRATVIDYFYQTYGLEYGKDFWITSKNGENPEQIAKERTLELLVKRKVELGLAELKGLIKGSSYSDMLRAMEEENKRRQTAVQAKQAIYGPVHMDEDTFTPYYMSNVRIALKEKLSEDELQVSREELERQYEQRKDSLAAGFDEIAFRRISVSYRDDGGDHESTVAARKQSAEERLFAIKQLLDKGMEPEEAVKQVDAARRAEMPEIRDEVQQLNAATASMYYKSQPALYAVLEGDLKIGETSAVFEEAAAGEYVLIQITGREAGAEESFEKNESVIRSSWLDEVYTQYLNKRVEEAEVKVMEEEWEELKV